MTALAVSYPGAGMRLSVLGFGFAVTLCLQGCGGVTQEFVPTSSKVYPAKADSSHIDIYRAGQQPDYPYEEVGVVSAQKQARTAFGSASVSQLLPLIQQQARQLGADAIIIRDASAYRAPSLNGSLTIPAARVSGVAIRYVKPAAQSSLTLPPSSRVRPASALSAPELVAQARASVVQIETESAQGSGVIISANGLILTNDHVVHGASVLLVKLSDGRRTRAVLQASDTEADIALLRIGLDSLLPMPLGSVANLATGADVVVIGSPLGLEQTVSKGVVSSIRTSSSRRFIQTDAAVSPGNSGGPLINDHGEVIGIVSFKLASQLSEGLNFAIAIDDALASVGITRGPPH
jgi:S1-C subfamily serine protease